MFLYDCCAVLEKHANGKYNSVACDTSIARATCVWYHVYEIPGFDIVSAVSSLAVVWEAGGGGFG